MYEIAHVGVVVKNADSSSRFYEEALGCTVEGKVVTDTLKLVFLKAGAGFIELVEHLQASGAEQRGMGIVDHIAFVVPDMDQALEKLKQFNVTFLLETPKVLADKKIMFFSGPDGERLEFVQML